MDEVITEVKKDRKAWTIDKAIKTLNCGLIGLSINITELTQKAKQFLLLYGLKQFLSDSIAAMGGKEYTNKERVAKCLSKFAPLCNEKCSLQITESGTFHWNDPDKVIVRITREEQLEKIRKNAVLEMVKNGIPEGQAMKIAGSITF